MQTPHIPRHSTRRAAENTKRKVKRWFIRRARQSTCILESAPTRYVELLPQSRWDRIVLLMFMCSLLTFLRALGGFGFVDETPRSLNHTLVYPSTPAPLSPTSQRGIDSRNKEWVVDAQGVTREVVGWHGEYELFPNTASALNTPPSIPQDAFPDPTPVLDGIEHESALNIPLSMTSGINAGIDFSAAFHGVPYDPFHLDFEGFNEGSENDGLYPVAGPPSTARPSTRPRRFGRCLAGEDCM